MILVHRLRGEPLYVNADLIETVESTPDTVLGLLDGRRLLVDESPEVIVERFTAFRAAVLADAEDRRQTDAPSLTLITDREV